jgi:hypothetical protein
MEFEFIESSIMPDGQIETLAKVNGEYKMIPGTLQPASIGFELTGNKYRVKALDVYEAYLVADRTVDRKEIQDTFVGEILLGTEIDREIVGVDLFATKEYAPGMRMGIAVKHLTNKPTNQDNKTMLLKLLLDKSTLGDLIFMLPKTRFIESFSDSETTQEDSIEALAEDIKEFYDTVGVQEDQIAGTEYEATEMARYWFERRM